MTKRRFQAESYRFERQSSDRCHAWSSDPEGQAEIRAAEDGRDRPLPTLAQCIEQAKQVASGGGEQPRGWLTEEEREAVQWAADAAYDKQHPAEDTLRSVLARSSPPEIVLKDFPPGTIQNLDSHYLAGWSQCMALAKKAIAAAGVAVKEVGK